jgi:type II secretory pathway pseudopilin PulG
MKIIKTNRRALQSGTTLVELSVVIAVILLLVGVLFIGVQAWRNAANNAACLVNLATIQKAVRGYENAHLLNPGQAVTVANLEAATGDGYFGASMPFCPAGDATTGAYTYTAAAAGGGAYGAAGGVVPDQGVLFAQCPKGHAPTSHDQW